jgi:hypothetical protein
MAAMTLDDVTVVIVPGLRDHVAEHWQTLLANHLPRSRTVEPLTHDKLSCAARVAALEETLACGRRPGAAGVPQRRRDDHRPLGAAATTVPSWARCWRPGRSRGTDARRLPAA